VSECTESRAIVSTIVFLAKSLKLSTVAEGVEQKEELEFLRELGCHQYQGFFFSRPVPSNAILGLLSHKC
jgi:EAL domain-containing protein (putative c-di-GMP-specific phosphodiesterase class I)